MATSPDPDEVALGKRSGHTTTRSRPRGVSGLPDRRTPVTLRCMAEAGWVADALVIFGITGDLARRMTFPALYRLEQRGTLTFPVIGVASSLLTPEELRATGPGSAY